MAFLQRAVERQQIAQSNLFVGAASIGKTHLALELASALNCLDDAAPCGICGVCVRTAKGVHPDVTLVEPDGGRLKIDQIRALQHTLSLSPREGRRRVCIVTDFQTATVEAANAFLKTLEEPPARVVIILTATDAGLLPPTIVSRCQLLSLHMVSTQAIESALIERWRLDKERARLLARLAAGRAGWAIRAANDPSLLEQRKQRFTEWRELLPQGAAAKIRAAEKLSKQEDLMEIVLLWQTWWRDVVLFSSGCEDLVVNTDLSDTLGQLAGRYDLGQAQAALGGTVTTLQQFEQNVNPRLALEVLFLSWHPVQWS